MSTEPTGLNRRDFIGLTLGWCTALFAAGASAAAGPGTSFRTCCTSRTNGSKALKPEDYPEGATFLPEMRAYLVRKGDRFRAVSAVCTHLGCTVNLGANGGGFHCPCHGSQFDGNGPHQRAGTEALAVVSVSLSRDGRLVIDTAQKVTANQELVVSHASSDSGISSAVRASGGRFSASDCRRATWSGRRQRSRVPAPRPAGQSPRADAEVQHDARAGADLVLPLHHPRGDRLAADVLLRAGDRPGVSIHEGPGVRRHGRAGVAQHALLGRRT